MNRVNIIKGVNNKQEMSIRFDMEKMQCSIKSKKDKVSVEFEDKFGLKYLEKITPK